jgi:hypothetical protein
LPKWHITAYIQTSFITPLGKKNEVLKKAQKSELWEEKFV